MTALEHLSQAIEPTVTTSTKGIQLRPEFYIQHEDQGVAVKAFDHTKLSYKQRFNGMGRVLQYLVSNGGDATSYLEHMNFVIKQAAAHNFMDQAYVAYDRAVVDKVICGPSKVFIAGDVLVVSSNSHAGNMLPVNPVTPHRSFGITTITNPAQVPIVKSNMFVLCVKGTLGSGLPAKKKRQQKSSLLPLAIAPHVRLSW